MSDKKKKIALVIGAGSVKCAAALGLWKVLEAEDIHFDMIVGCSGGSIYAAAMAMGFSLQECIDNTKKLWNRSITQTAELACARQCDFARNHEIRSPVQHDERWTDAEKLSIRVWGENICRYENPAVYHGNRF